MLKQIVTALGALVLTSSLAFAQHGGEGTPTANPTANPTVAPGTGTTATPPPIEAETADHGTAPAADAHHAAGAHPADDAHGDAHGGAHAGGHADPSKHFRFFGSPFSHNGHDIYGGKLGDDKMVDPHTGQVVLNHHGQPYEEPMSAPFIFMLLNFAILLGILAWKAGPMAGKMARDRSDQIKTALDEAAKLRKEAQTKLEQFETRLKDADAEIKAMVEGMRADAEADKKRILEAAATQAATMKREAEQRIAAEIEYARAALTREVTVAATRATETILREQVNHGDQAKLVTSFIAELGNAPAPKEAR